MVIVSGDKQMLEVEDVMQRSYVLPHLNLSNDT